MQLNDPVLALFADADDENTWYSSLSMIPEVIRIIANRFLLVTLDNMRGLGINPRLAIVSGALYPTMMPELIKELKNNFPRMEILVLSSTVAPFPQIERLLTDKVRHLVIEPISQNAALCRNQSPLLLAVNNLVNKQKWEIAEYVKDGTQIHVFQLSSSNEKEQVIGTIESMVQGETAEHELLRQKGALLADEMLENAFYGAPKGADGNKIFRKGEQRSLLPGEKIVFSFAFDGETLAMEMADNWGSLAPDMIMEYLARNQNSIGLPDDIGGRGLFIIWRFLDQFHVNITPGNQTVVGGHLRVSSPFPPEAPRGFHITTTEKEKINGCTITHRS
ncbi:ATP-binding protein [Geotalea uraniireducens]|uniref:Uncharacterized protein n=1 Tax=Geotalea uraniireducens (strain Rf4) TaxID=351605 RepID=A5GE56_GEOUR|nr:hypothetical protein [Geotalea uraniireducens]ABQ25711.1 hypothetical protein Gura_1512 [Geotalea uraniireducens Rf4]